MCPACLSSFASSASLITKQTQGNQLAASLGKGSEASSLLTAVALLAFASLPHPHARPAAGAQLPSQAKPPSPALSPLLLGLARAGRPNLDRKAEAAGLFPSSLASDLAPDLLRPLLPTTILSIQRRPLETQLLPSASDCPILLPLPPRPDRRPPISLRYRPLAWNGWISHSSSPAGSPTKL